MRMSRTGMALTLASLMLMGACGDSTAELDDVGEVRVMLTDAPADYLSEAVVCISQVYLQVEDDEEGEEEEGNASRVVLWEKGEDEPQCPDLLELQGVSVEVAEAEVPAGTYAQLRFIVESAAVTLAEGYEFNSGGNTQDLQVPSGAQTGIKVLLLDPVVVEAQTVNEMTVDADVNANFVIQGNPETAAGIQGVLFTPVLKEIDPAG